MRELSPVGPASNTGNSHTVYINGSPVGDRVPKTIQPGDEIMIANPVPYARRLEIGRAQHGARPFLISVPNRIYERVTDMVKAQGQGEGEGSHGLCRSWRMDVAQEPADADQGRDGYRYSARQRPDRLAGAIVKSPAIYIHGANLMTTEVETAVYRLRIEGQEEVDRATRSVEGLAKAEDKLASANRTTSAQIQRGIAAYDPVIRAQEKYLAAMKQIENARERNGFGNTVGGSACTRKKGL